MIIATPYVNLFSHFVFDTIFLTKLKLFGFSKFKVKEQDLNRRIHQNNIFKDAQLLSFPKYIVEESEIDLLVDVGTNHGQFVAYFISKSRLNTIFIQPNTTQAKLISLKNPNHQFFSCAISDFEGTANFFYDPTHGGGVYINDVNDKFTKEKSPVTTLDSLLKNIVSKNTFIKIDVEGDEVRVLKGVILTIKNRNPWFVVEFGDADLRLNDAKNILRGYQSNGLVIPGLGYQTNVCRRSFNLLLTLISRKCYSNPYLFDRFSSGVFCVPPDSDEVFEKIVKKFQVKGINLREQE